VTVEGVSQEVDSLLHGEHRLLVLRVAHHADDDAVEDRCRARDDVEVAIRHRVVRPRADSGDGRSLLHCARKTVTRADP
jgi:hypothetical protein